MKLKHLVVITLLGSLPQVGRAEVITLVATAPVGGEAQSESISVGPNQVATALYAFTPPESSPAGEAVRIPLLQVTIGTNSFVHKGNEIRNVVVGGPATLRLKVSNTNTFYQTPASTFCTLRIDRAPAQAVPNNAVVIPSDAAGPVNIILESSTDLVSWTEALPGTYGSSTSNRFFRVRAELQ